MVWRRRANATARSAKPCSDASARTRRGPRTGTPSLATVRNLPLRLDQRRSDRPLVVLPEPPHPQGPDTGNSQNVPQPRRVVLSSSSGVNQYDKSQQAEGCSRDWDHRREQTNTQHEQRIALKDGCDECTDDQIVRREGYMPSDKRDAIESPIICHEPRKPCRGASSFRSELT